ncbi:MAG: periplasmic heavy metal sensor [bacterium]|nr:periplasmic heavy metal sensor [bacterium]
MARNEDGNRNDKFYHLDHWGTPIVGVLTILLALVAISASQAETTSSTDAGEVCASGECEERSHGRWGHHRRGHRFFGHRGHDPEIAKERMQFAAGWMLKRLDVEQEVRDQIQARLDTAFDDLLPIMEEHKGSRDVWLEAVLGEDGIDREVLEAQRETSMASADRAAQIVTTALADVAEMLTPEQRAEIAERIRRHHR